MKTKTWVELNEDRNDGSTILYVSNDKLFRIIQKPDYYYDLDEHCRELKEDWGKYCSAKKLAQMEKKHRDWVEQCGVWAVVLEKWNPDPDCGYTHAFSVWGIIEEPDGSYFKVFVREMKATAKELRKAG